MTAETEEEEEDEDEGVVVKGFPLKPTKFRGLKSKQVMVFKVTVIVIGIMIVVTVVVVASVVVSSGGSNWDKWRYVGSIGAGFGGDEKNHGCIVNMFCKVS